MTTLAPSAIEIDRAPPLARRLIRHCDFVITIEAATAFAKKHERKPEHIDLQAKTIKTQADADKFNRIWGR